MTIIFDLDCLADDSHRRHFIENPYSCFGEAPDCNCSDPQREFSCPFDDYNSWKPDYKAYNEACGKDIFNENIGDLYRCLWASPLKTFQCRLWSSRSEDFRAKTNTWLLMNKIYQGETLINLKMRPNHLGHTEFPQEKLFESWADQFAASGKTIEFVFSKHKPTIEMFRKRGIFVFDCNQERE